MATSAENGNASGDYTCGILPFFLLPASFFLRANLPVFFWNCLSGFEMTDTATGDRPRPNEIGSPSALESQELQVTLSHPFLPVLFCLLVFTVFLPYYPIHMSVFHNPLLPASLPKVLTWLPVRWLNGHISKSLSDRVTRCALAFRTKKKTDTVYRNVWTPKVS